MAIRVAINGFGRIGRQVYKAIREKYRKSKDAAARAKVNEEIMALYQREGINPMASLGGCLPLLLQLPILYGFYSVLTVSASGRDRR